MLLAIIMLGLFLWMPLTGIAYGPREIYTPGYEVGGVSIRSFGGVYIYLINLIIVCTAAALTILSIFLYKRRPLQILLCWFAIIFICSSEAFVYYHYMTRTCGYDGIKSIDCESIFTAWNLLALGAVIMEFMAITYIRKDEQLIKSMDRLR